MSLSVIQSTEVSKTANENVETFGFVTSSAGYQIKDGSVNTTNLCQNPPCSGGW